MKPDLRKRETMSEKNKANNRERRERFQGRWFEALKMRREGKKWKDIADHFKCDIAFAYRLARKAENLERKGIGLGEIMPRTGKKTRVFVICENKRFYCIDRIYWDGIKPLECECGSKQFPTDSARGVELKKLRANCKTALMTGDTRDQGRPSLCSRFAEPVILDNETSRMLNL